MFRAAGARASAIFVGVTDGALANRARSIPAVSVRMDAVRAAFAALQFDGDLVVRPLTDAGGPATTGDYDGIVISPETRSGASNINNTRRAAGLPDLKIIEVPHVLAQDWLPISATRLARGDIDAAGHRLSPVRVAVGSQNPVKVKASLDEMSSLLGLTIEIREFDVASGVPEQPTASHTMQGARTRAAAAASAWPEADYALGIEAGLQQHDDEWFDMQACAIVDHSGRWTSGWGPGFMYPEWATQRARDGEMISDIIGPVANDPSIGGTTGAIGYLTKGHMDRTELTRIAIRMAVIPRIRRNLYDAGSAAQAVQA
jgi:inosine/xanthosine triphosphatase